MKSQRFYKIPNEEIYFGGFNTFNQVEILPKGSVFIYHNAWSINVFNIKSWVQYDRKSKAHGVNFIYGVNTIIEMLLTRLFGKKSYLLNHNMHVCENIFFIEKENKIYDHILVSQVQRFKNIEYAISLSRLAYICYGNRDSIVFVDFIARVKDLSFINDDFCDGDNMRNLYCKSKIYVIMSRREGANLATVEALLCGLPVLTLKSMGGREYWLSKSNSVVFLFLANRTVQRASKKILDLFDSKVFNPSEIRESVLSNIWKQRVDFITIVYKYTRNNTLDRKDDLIKEIWGGRSGIENIACHI